MARFCLGVVAGPAGLETGSGLGPCRSWPRLGGCKIGVSLLWFAAVFGLVPVYGRGLALRKYGRDLKFAKPEAKELEYPNRPDVNEPHANDLQPVRVGTAMRGHIPRPLCRSVGLRCRVFDLSLTFSVEVVGGSLGRAVRLKIAFIHNACLLELPAYW